MGRMSFRAIAIALVLVFIGLMAYLLVQATHQNRHRLREHEAMVQLEDFERVKSGEDGGSIVIHDPALIEMFAKTPECVTSLESLNLSMVDLSDPRFRKINQLTGVRKIFLYSCTSADELLMAIKGMPSVEEILFETTPLTEDSIELLTTFPNLKKVRFEQVVTRSSGKRLNKALPNVKVEIPFPATP